MTNNLTNNHHAPIQPVAPETPTRPPSLVRDPVFILTVGAFAIITTALPAALGQLRFMPIIQALALTTFLGMALRRIDLGAAFRVLGVWLAIQFGVMLLLTILLPPHIIERAIVDGFAHRQGLLEWIYTDAAYPGGILTRPLAYLIEAAGILLGALATGGLVGIWFFVRLINLTAYTIGSLTYMADGPLAALMPLIVWPLLRIAGYTCLIPLFASPLLTGNWGLGKLWQDHRRLMLTGIALVLAGIVAELLLAPLWTTMAADM